MARESRERVLGRARTCGLRGAIALSAAIACFGATALDASAISLSPLNGTPDASPLTQISFLGVPVGEISKVSVVGTSSGRHGGHLVPYASATGASFLVAHPFREGERVTASAVVGSGGHGRLLSTTFTVARVTSYQPPPLGKPAPARPGAVQSFVSRPDLHPPNVSLLASSPRAAKGDVFLTPTHGLGQSGPMIIDEQGGLVWYQPVATGDVATDLQVQSYRGKPVLVWWQGYLSQLGIGLGEDEIYSPSYEPVAAVSAGNGYRADLHDIQITASGAALITAYAFVRADLSAAGGSRQGTLLDSVVQEIDIATGLVMFEWHSDGHVPLSDSYTTPGAAAQPWDFFHVNSISQDPWGDGNFIISARNTWAAYEIDHHAGAVQWRLGGKRPSFKMGKGTGVAWQHDVRWQPDHTLTLFDDGAAPKVHSQSRAIRERIDWHRRTVVLTDRVVHPRHLLAGSQGNDQVLPNGDSFVGWGEVPFLTEFSPTGEVLFDARLPAPGDSYRAYRFPWSGTPLAPPAVAVRAGGPGTVTVYASWNGASGVSAWRVLAGTSPEALAPGTTVSRSGFETAIPQPATDTWFAVQALDPAGQVLGSSPAAHA